MCTGPYSFITTFPRGFARLRCNMLVNLSHTFVCFIYFQPLTQQESVTDLPLRCSTIPLPPEDRCVVPEGSLGLDDNCVAGKQGRLTAALSGSSPDGWCLFNFTPPALCGSPDDFSTTTPAIRLSTDHTHTHTHTKRPPLNFLQHQTPLLREKRRKRASVSCEMERWEVQKVWEIKIEELRKRDWEVGKGMTIRPSERPDSFVRLNKRSVLYFCSKLPLFTHGQLDTSWLLRVI